MLRKINFHFDNWLSGKSKAALDPSLALPFGMLSQTRGKLSVPQTDQGNKKLNIFVGAKNSTVPPWGYMKKPLSQEKTLGLCQATDAKPFSCIALGIDGCCLPTLVFLFLATDQCSLSCLWKKRRLSCRVVGIEKLVLNINSR